jgi:hypothetical protein
LTTSDENTVGLSVEKTVGGGKKEEGGGEEGIPYYTILCSFHIMVYSLLFISVKTLKQLIKNKKEKKR